MCLIKLKSQPLGPKIAKEDITVFKVLKEYNYIVPEYTSPYRDHTYEMGKTYKSYLDNPRTGYRSRTLISKGIHSFRSKAAANKLIKELPSTLTSWLNLVIVQCVIPKGSKYHLGYNLEIVSDKLKIVCQ